MALRITKFLLSLLVPLLLSVVPANAGLIIWEFGTVGDPGPGLTLYADPGFGVTYPGDWATFTKTTGTGDGWARLLTDASFSGDFLALTVARRDPNPPHNDDLSGQAELGLAVYFDWPPAAGDPFADILFSGQDQIYSWVYASAAHNTAAFANDSSTTAWLRIRRVGTTIYDDYCTSDNYYTCNWTQLATLSDPLLGGPVRVGLFLAQEQGNTNSHRGEFDVLGVDSAVPEPGTIVLLGAGAVALFLFRTRRTPG